MIILRKSNERGHADHGWLNARHSFSFGHYVDPKHMGYGPLRVINEDQIDPAMGFGTHPHRDMEIITYIIDGSLEHKDSMGNGSVIRSGDLQVMSAGTGIRHSEFNHSAKAPLHLMQIWIEPSQTGITPRYDQTHLDPTQARNKLRLVVSGDGRDQSLRIHQDANLYNAVIEAGHEVTHDITSKRKVWVQVVKGDLTLGSHHLHAGDGAAIDNEHSIKLVANQDSEVLVFDLAG